MAIFYETLRMFPIVSDQGSLDLSSSNFFLGPQYPKDIGARHQLHNYQ
jgi:hypothetical protein